MWSLVSGSYGSTHDLPGNRHGEAHVVLGKKYKTQIQTVYMLYHSILPPSLQRPKANSVLVSFIQLGASAVLRTRDVLKIGTNCKD